MARNRKRANRRSTRPPRPAGSGQGAAGAQENGRTEVEPEDLELEADDAVEGPVAGPEAVADTGLDESGLVPVDLEATNIPPIDFGLDTGRTPEAEIEAGSEREPEDDSVAPVEGEASEVVDADVEDEDVEEFLDEHPDDAADTEDYRDQEDVAADADTDYYDEDGLDDETGVAVVPRSSDSPRRPRSKERKSASKETTPAVAEHSVSAPVRLAHFVQGSWRELQRVQWPDRRQVMQATGVVVGFVIVAGAFLGVADYLSTKLINFILG